MLLDVLARVRSLRAREVDGDRARRQAIATSGTFAGHRRYTAGDDLRRVDWNAYARGRELFVTVLEDDRQRALTVLLDTSASMGAGAPPRFHGALRIAGLLGALALARLDGVQVAAGEERFGLAGTRRVDALLRRLAALDTTGARSLPDVAGGVESLRGRVVWISDFADLDATAHGLLRFAHRRRDVVGLLPRIPEDRLIEADGWIRVRDPERGIERRVAVDARLRDALKDELARLHGRRRDVFARAGVPLLEVDVPAEGDFRAESWLAGGWTRRI